jgi:hypothetical protein
MRPRGRPQRRSALRQRLGEAPGFSCDPGLACFRSFPQAGRFNQGVVSRADGSAVQFAGNCLLQPNDIWDLRYLTNR